MRVAKSFLIGVVLLGLGLGTLAACSLTSVQPTPAPAQPTTVSSASPEPTVASSAPQGADGAALLSDRCTSCHSLSRVTRFRGTRSQWDQLVANMISRGASLTAAEKTVLVDYLTKTYGQ
jgi:cytochrome c5